MAKGKKRIKASATLWTAQTKDKVIAEIKQLCDVRRELVRVETEINNAIAEITDSNSPVIEGLEAHRDELTNGGKVKFVNLTTGVFLSVSACNDLSVRKEEINKDAMINEKEAVKNILGITIKSDIEDFSIISFEHDV